MPIPSIVKQIKKSLDVRKRAKQELDNSVNLSSLEKPHTVTLTSSGYTNAPTRLLDEGAVMYEGGEKVRLYFMKGVLENFYNSLEDDFVGYINLAHIDIFSLPLNLGTWTKESLSLIDLGDGRKGLDVSVALNRKLHIVQDLLNQEIPLSVSAELSCNIDWKKSFQLGFYCVNKIDIKGFSVVGNPANVNSSGVNLQIEGEENMNIKELKELLSSKADELSVEKENLSTEETKVEEKLEEKQAEEVVTEEKMELSEEQLSVLNNFMEKFTDLQSRVEALEKENEELKTENESLKSTEEENVKVSSKADDVISKLESLLNGVSTKKEEKLASVEDSYMGLGNLEKGE